MAVTDIIIPSCIDPAFFMAKIANAKPGFWFDICGGAAPVSGTVINLTELVPQKYVARPGNAIVYNDSTPRTQPVILSLFDYQQQMRRDAANQDRGGAIERDMINAANKAVRFGDSLMVTAITGGAKTMDNVAVISAAHGTQSNTWVSGQTAATLTVAQADAALAGGVDQIRTFQDDSGDTSTLLNTYATSFTVLTSSTTRFSQYNSAMANKNSGTYLLPGYINGGINLKTAYLPGLNAKKDYVIRNGNDGSDPAFVSGIYGDKAWAGVNEPFDAYQWYHSFNQAVVPFRWQSILEITYA